MSRPGFRSVVRARVSERIAQACAYPVALIVAPAGYGKSVALRHYLAAVSAQYVRFDVRREHAALPAFLGAFAESLSGVAPHMAAALPDALRGSPSADELAAWFNAQLQDYRGLIILDDLQFATGPEILPFLRSAIDVTKHRTHWLIATRSVPDLPVATWITYGDMDLAVDERDLAFTVEEAREASTDTGAHDDELRRIVEMTNGWATALNFALRMRLRTSELAAIGTMTREMVYRYLAEQVYERLGPSERELLHFAAYLPEIDVELLIKAGFADAFATLEWLRLSAAFLSVDGKRRYRCHDLFREFLQHRTELLGRVESRALQVRVAELLIQDGRIPEALYLYIGAHAEIEICRTLERHGFELAHAGRNDVIDACLAVVRSAELVHSPPIVALRGMRESDHGRFDAAEALLRDAMQRSNDAVFRAKVAIRYAQDLQSQDRDATHVLQPLLDESLPQTIRALAAGQLAVTHARAGRVEEARGAIDLSEKLVSAEASDGLRARLLCRIGSAKFYLNANSSEVAPMFQTAYRLAAEKGLYLTMSTALGALAYVALFFDDDQPKSRQYIEEAIVAAEKSGHRYSIHLALSFAISAHSQAGNKSDVVQLMRRLREATTTDKNRQKILQITEALIAAWDGDFEKAYRCSPRDFAAFYNFSQVACRAKWALYAIAANAREDALSLVRENLREVASQDFGHVHGRQTAEMSRLLCAAVEAFAGRLTAARQILKAKPLRDDVPVRALRVVVNAIIDSIAYGRGPHRALASLDGLTESGYGGLSHILDGMIRRLIAPQTETPLTEAECLVLRDLDAGHSPKEIAVESGRSIHTVRTLIQRATEKLGCSGRQQAIAEARRRGLLDNQTAGRSSVPA